jgi:ADP-heptose:LPS heptosyltransferase
MALTLLTPISHRRHRLLGLFEEARLNVVFLLVWLLDGLVIGLAKSCFWLGATYTNSHDHRKSVTFVRVDLIGDFILWMASFEGLQKIFPKEAYRWKLICNSPCRELAEKSALFDEIVPLDLRRFSQKIRYRVSVLFSLAQTRATVIFQPTYSRSLRTGDAIVRAVSAAQKIGPRCDDANVTAFHSWLGDRSYTRLLPTSLALPSAPLMELRRNAEILSALSGSPVAAKEPDLRLFAQNVNFPLPAEPYFVIFPAASRRGREWPLERFLEIAERVQARTGWLCVYGGSVEDRVRLQAALDANSKICSKNLQGQTSVSELVKVIAGAKLLLANETSAAHVGKACHVPTICLLGGGHFGRFFPWRTSTEFTPLEKDADAVFHPMTCFHCNWDCVFEVAEDVAKPCLTAITVEQVWQALREKLTLVP